MFATAALLIYRVRGDQDAMQYAGLGAAIMGMWSAQGTSSSSLMARERWNGTLELLVASPTPLARILTPASLALSTIGLYCVAVTLLWERFAFGLTLHVASWPLFVLAVLACAGSLSLFGYFLSVAAVRYRTSWVIGAALEYPGWLVGGFLVPVASLPARLRPLSWISPVTWAMAAVRDAAAGRPLWAHLGLCALVALSYAAVAAVATRIAVDSARRHASLALT